MTAWQKCIDHFPHLRANKIKDIDTGSRPSEILNTQSLSMTTAAICLWIRTTVIARNPGWQSSETMCALSLEVWEDK